VQAYGSAMHLGSDRMKQDPSCPHPDCNAAQGQMASGPQLFVSGELAITSSRRGLDLLLPRHVSRADF
jgi:hypothetical protein